MDDNVSIANLIECVEYNDLSHDSSTVMESLPGHKVALISSLPVLSTLCSRSTTQGLPQFIRIFGQRFQFAS